MKSESKENIIQNYNYLNVITLQQQIQVLLYYHVLKIS